MKKVLIIIPSFQNGGTTTSLINILTTGLFNDLDIDVYAIRKVGPNKEIIGNYCKIYGVGIKNSNHIKGFSVSSIINKIISFSKKSLSIFNINANELFFKKEVNRLKKNNYNVVIGFQEGQATKFASLFESSYRVAWVHCDYSNMLRITKTMPNHKLYSQIDKIVCVSEYTKNVFVRLLPETQDKVVAIHNLIDIERIKKLSEQPVQDEVFSNYNGFRIVSIGRIDPVKRFSYIPSIGKQLKDAGINFRWYIIGSGNEQELVKIKKAILQNHVKDCVLLMGNKDNPYPYIKSSDILVITSESEACPYVLNEAKALKVPVISSKYGSAAEFISEGINGFIDKIEDVPKRLINVLSNEHILNDLRDNTTDFDINTTSISLLRKVLQNEA